MREPVRPTPEFETAELEFAREVIGDVVSKLADYLADSRRYVSRIATRHGRYVSRNVEQSAGLTVHIAERNAADVISHPRLSDTQKADYVTRLASSIAVGTSDETMFSQRAEDEVSNAIERFNGIYSKRLEELGAQSPEMEATS